MPSTTQPSDKKDKNWLRSGIGIVPGLGKSDAAKLAKIKVATIADLLRARQDQLERGIGENADNQQIACWRYFASLLQVRHVIPDLASVFLQNKIFTPEELSHRKAGEVLALCTGIVALDHDDVAEMLCDATVLALTGTLFGTVRDKEGNAVQGVEASICGMRQKSDALGRFFFNRLPPAGSKRLVLSHPDYLSLAAENVPCHANALATGVRIYQLLSKLDGDTNAVPAASTQDRIQSEFDGDLLPTPLGEQVKELQGRLSEMRDGDILRLHSYYANGREAKLVSRFKSFDGSQFLVHVYRIPKGLVPADAKPRQHFRWRNGALAKIDISAEGMTKELLRRRMRLQFRNDGLASGAPINKRKQEMEERIGFLLGAGAFRGRTE